MRNIRFQIMRNLNSAVVYTESIKSELQRTAEELVDGNMTQVPVIPTDIVPEATRQELSDIHARLETIKGEIEAAVAAKNPEGGV